MNFVTKVLALLSCYSLFTVTLQAPCHSRNIKPRKALKRLRNNYLFVENFPEEISIKQKVIKRRTRRDILEGKVAGGIHCSWIWEQEDSSLLGITQKPRFFTKAVCSGSSCKQYCTPVTYTIKVLIKKGCDKRTGEETWKWQDKTIPIAYVYNP